MLGVLARILFSRGEFLDTFYLERRKNTVIIGLSCKTILSTCFAPLLTAGHDGTGADLMFTELGDKYYVEVNTEKGKSLVEAYSQYFLKRTQRSWPRQKKNRLKTGGTVYQKRVDLDGVKKVLDENFELPYWEKVFRKCLGCGICTYVCPTCHCFDIFDYTTGEFTGNRFRCWDSCMFPDFTPNGRGSQTPVRPGKSGCATALCTSLNTTWTAITWTAASAVEDVLPSVR